MGGYRSVTEALAVLTAASKIVDAERDGARAAANAQLESLYRASDTDRLSLKVNGREVGKLSGRFSKPSRETKFVVSDYDELREWFAQLPADELAGYASDHMEKFAEWHLRRTGEVPSGCDVVDVEHDGGEWVGTMISGCKPEKVAEALGYGLFEYVDEVVGYLGSGSVEV